MRKETFLRYLSQCDNGLWIDFIDQAHQEKKPLFLLIGYNAPISLCTHRKEVTDKYMSLYMQGWDKIRDARWKRIVDPQETYAGKSRHLVRVV